MDKQSCWIIRTSCQCELPIQLSHVSSPFSSLSQSENKRHWLLVHLNMNSVQSAIKSGVYLLRIKKTEVNFYVVYHLGLDVLFFLCSVSYAWFSEQVLKLPVLHTYFYALETVFLSREVGRLRNLSTSAGVIRKVCLLQLHGLFVAT